MRRMLFSQSQLVITPSVSQTAEALNPTYIVKEYSINVMDKALNVSFSPSRSYSNVYAFVDGIENVSMPDIFSSPDGTIMMVGSTAPLTSITPPHLRMFTGWMWAGTISHLPMTPASSGNGTKALLTSLGQHLVLRIHLIRRLILLILQTCPLTLLRRMCNPQRGQWVPMRTSTGITTWHGFSRSILGSLTWSSYTSARSWRT